MMEVAEAEPSEQRTQALDLLWHAFQAFSEVVVDPDPKQRQERLMDLGVQVQANGLHGLNSLQALMENASLIKWEAMAPEPFSLFYRFAFFLLREPGRAKRNVATPVALAGWRLLMQGRFRLLARWCTFVEARHAVAVITEDTWRQVLDFSRSVHEDCSNYDPSAAWPVLLDEFVDSLRSASSAAHAGGDCAGMGASSECRSSMAGACWNEGFICGAHHAAAGPALGSYGRDAGHNHSARHALHCCSPWSPPRRGLCSPDTARGMRAVAPRCGSKRRVPDVEAVADQLQHMPLVSEGSERAPPGSDHMTCDFKRARPWSAGAAVCKDVPGAAFRQAADGGLAEHAPGCSPMAVSPLRAPAPQQPQLAASDPQPLVQTAPPRVLSASLASCPVPRADQEHAPLLPSTALACLPSRLARTGGVSGLGPSGAADLRAQLPPGSTGSHSSGGGAGLVAPPLPPSHPQQQVGTAGGAPILQACRSALYYSAHGGFATVPAEHPSVHALLSHTVSSALGLGASNH